MAKAIKKQALKEGYPLLKSGNDIKSVNADKVVGNIELEMRLNEQFVFMKNH
jgi:hypothetical protein